MPEASSQPDPAAGETGHRAWGWHLWVEVLAVVVLVAVVAWLSVNYQPRTFLGKGLLNHRLWILVLLISGWGTAGSLIPYYVGQRGTRAVFEHYPKLQGRPWERLEAAFQRWGAFSLILSGIPGLGAALLVGAGAFGIKRSVFLVWVYIGKVLRYWIVAFVVLASLQFVG